MILTAVILVVLANKDFPTYVYDGTKKIISSVIYSRRSNIWNTEKAIQVFNILEKMSDHVAVENRKRRVLSEDNQKHCK